jgi:2-polyprenyl-6-methoxyphenol hydroxylase-like FAD-dependent oxidoreductase
LAGRVEVARPVVRQLLETEPGFRARAFAPSVDVSKVEIERRAIYAFHARVADKWHKERVLLAGDAAHFMPPFAGQGMNSGMKDAVNLGWKLAAVVAGSAGAHILDSYEIERASSVRALVNLSRLLTGGGHAGLLSEMCESRRGREGQGCPG